MAQLTCAQARELAAHGPHLDEHPLGAPGRRRLALAALVAVMPADYAAHAALTGSA